MGNTDRFGLKRELAILHSGVRTIFTPHQPIVKGELLFGRGEEVRRLVEHINTPGQHALLYGERGVGKSSLANVTADVLLGDLITGDLHKKLCDSSDSFASIVRGPLQATGVDVELQEISEEVSRKKHGSIGWKGLGAGAEKGSATTATYRASELSPSMVAELLKDKDDVLLVDEADAIREEDDKRKLAELIKHLSDNGSDFKVLVVGIAETGGDLTGAHPSVARCLRETKLGRMSDAELREIVTTGAATLGLDFTSATVSAIVECSAGYPHFTHLLALKCAEEAIVEGRTEIRKEHLEQAMKLSVADAEGGLKRMYDAAVRSYSTDMYRVILVAAASLSGPEFTAEELRASIADITGEPISQGSLNNYFGRLVSRDGTRIIRRAAKGIYHFSDPRMPSFIRIANQMV
jgi:hypothetical protein